MAAFSLTVASTFSLLYGCGGLPALPGMDAGASWSGVTFSSSDERKTAILSNGDRDKFTKLNEIGADIMSVDVPGRRAQVTLTEAQAKVAEKLGFSVQWNGSNHRRDDKGYRTYDQVAERLKQLAAQAPEIATLVDIGDGWEKTQGKGDRDIWALHIKRGNGSKPVVLFRGTDVGGSPRIG